MPLIITEFARQADGTFAVEFHNSGPGAVDLVDFNIGVSTTGAPGGGFSLLSATSRPLAAGKFYTLGHSSIAGLDATPNDTLFSTTTIDLVVLFENAALVDHFGEQDGPELGSDVVYHGPLDRVRDPDQNNSNTANFTVTSGFGTNTLEAACFLAGTRIATPEGERPVEGLAIGDPVCTADGRDVPVRWIGRQVLRATIGREGEHLRPVRIRAGALGHGLPRTDLMVTADHGMILDGLVINAGALVNGDTIDWVPLADLPASFTVYHVETEAHDVILANGAPAETFIDYVGRSAFDNHAEYLALYGCERIIPEMARPRISTARLLPEAIRARLGIGPGMRRVAVG